MQSERESQDTFAPGADGIQSFRVITPPDDDENDDRVSLYPLTPEEALRGLLATPALDKDED